MICGFTVVQMELNHHSAYRIEETEITVAMAASSCTGLFDLTIRGRSGTIPRCDKKFPGVSCLAIWTLTCPYLQIR
jgi:hypothetical protein